MPVASDNAVRAHDPEPPAMTQTSITTQVQPPQTGGESVPDLETPFHRMLKLVKEESARAAKRSDAYGRAFSEMNFDEEKIRRLRNLIGVSTLAAEQVKEGRRRGVYRSKREADDAYDTACAEAELEIKALLTPEQYARFERARDEKPVRGDVGGFDICLKNRVQELTDEAFEKMVEVASAAYRRHGVNPDLSSTYALGSERARNNYFRAREAAHAEIVREASTFLGANQVDVLKYFQSMQLDGAIDMWRRWPPGDN